MAVPHKNPSRTRIPMQIINMGEVGDCHILVDAKVAKRKITFIIDTGCSFTTIRSDFKHLGTPVEVEAATDQAYTVGGAVDSYGFVEVDSLVIGRLHLPPTIVALMEFPAVEKIYRDHFGITVDGLLGSDILNRHRAVINYAQRSLTLYNLDNDASGTL